MERLPNEEEKHRMQELVNKVAEYFTKHKKYGDVLLPPDLAILIGGNLREMWTAVNVCRMNGMLILQNSTGLFIGKNREQYDLWWRIYMQPSMQTLIAIQRGMKVSAQTLPQVLRPRMPTKKAKGKNNGKG